MHTDGLAALGALVLIVAACAGPGTTPAPSPSPSPGPATPTTTPAAAFGFDVLPAEDPVEARVAIPGEKVSFLVMVSDQDGSLSPVDVAATAVGAKVTAIKFSPLVPGVVGEVWVVPNPTTVDAVATVTITATRAGLTRTAERSIKVMPMADERAKDAKPYFDRWVAWLAAKHPELGITASTTWDPTFVSTFLVVSHYAYYSDDWEMKVSWHVMIAPSDWSEVYLRHRGNESKPSIAFRIDSVSGGTEPHPVAPPDEIMR